MFFKLFKILKRKTLPLYLLLITPGLSADWFALNMTRGITDISNEVFELHMLIFWICVAIGALVFFDYVLLNVGTHKRKKSGSS